MGSCTSNTSVKSVVDIKYKPETDRHHRNAVKSKPSRAQSSFERNTSNRSASGVHIQEISHESLPGVNTSNSEEPSASAGDLGRQEQSQRRDDDEKLELSRPAASTVGSLQTLASNSLSSLAGKRNRLSVGALGTSTCPAHKEERPEHLTKQVVPFDLRGDYNRHPDSPSSVSRSRSRSMSYTFQITSGSLRQANRNKAQKFAEEARLAEITNGPEDADENNALDRAAIMMIPPSPEEASVSRNEDSQVHHEPVVLRSPANGNAHTRTKSQPLPERASQQYVHQALQLHDAVSLNSLKKLKILGRGHFAKVHEVVNSRGEHYALKATSRKHKRVALNEAHVLHVLPPHPNVIGFHGSHDDSEAFYLLLDLCKGGDLLSYMGDHPSCAVYERTKASIIRQLVLAINHVHSHGIIHRDIKPENIVLLRRMTSGAQVPHVKLTDFGCVSLKNAPARPHRFAGTTSYSCPEVLNQMEANRSADMWGIGVVAYVLLGGYHPFDEFGKGVNKVTEKRILDMEWSFNDNTWDYVSDSAKDFVTKLLCLEPHRMSAEQALDHPFLRSAADTQRRDLAAVDMSGGH